MKYVSIDIETTGLDPESCQILEFAAVIDDTENIELVRELPQFRKILSHKEIHGEPYALNLNAELIRIISEGDAPDLIEPHLLGQAFAEFLVENGVNRMSVVAAGKNFASLDQRFLVKHRGFLTDFDYNDKEYELIRFRHRSLDPMMLFARASDMEPPSMKICMERAGLSGEVAHTALEDALTVVFLIRKGIKQ